MSKTNLKKEAEVLEKLIAEGSLTVEEVPLLVIHGLSQETVDYWQSHYRAPPMSTWTKLKQTLKW